MANEVDVPEEVVLGTLENDRGKYLKLNEDGKELWAKFGEPDYFHFSLKVGSDSAFAARVVEDLLFEKFSTVPTNDPTANDPTNA